MQCIHCGQNVLYKERGGRKCGKCKRDFAFEPKGHALRLHDVRFKKMSDRLTERGTLRFTPLQLHHALARKPLREQSLGAMAGVLALITIILVLGLVARSPWVLCSLPVFALIVGSTLHFHRHGPQALPGSERDFQALLNDWRSIHGPIPGLIEPSDLRWQGEQRVVPGALRAVLICSDLEILAWMCANQLDTQHALGLLSYSERLTSAEQALLSYVKAHPALPLLVLHDASLQGCLLPRLVAETLGGQGRPVLDLGLRPRQALKRKLVGLRAQPAPSLLAQLEATGRLTKEEHTWLSKGRWTPLAALKPAQLLALITNGLERLEAREAQLVERRARAVGFMSWPEEQR